MRSAYLMLIVLAALAAPSLSSNIAAAEDPGSEGFFHKAEIFRGSQLFLNGDNTVYMYETVHANADADGAPNAYSPADTGKSCKAPHVGLDCLVNAGYPTQSWWPDVLVSDPANKKIAFVQKDGPFKGFFVAQTSLRTAGGTPTDPATYVDATTVSYIVIPSGFSAQFSNAAKPGDVGLAILSSNGRMQTFIVADSGGGNTAKLGKASIALYAGLGFPDANPRTGAGLPHETIRYVVFPKSRSPNAKNWWPRTNEAIHDQVKDILQHKRGLNIGLP